MQRIAPIALISLLLTGTQAGAAPLACLIEPDKVAEIGAPRIGIIEKVAVERGDRVKGGQVLAYLRADVERAALGVARTRAQADADLQAALASHELAKSKLARSRHLVDVGFISKEALDQALAEERVARHRVEQAQEAQRAAQRELELSSSQLAQHVIRSPFDGVVTDRFRTEGERVEREAVVRVAKIDPLRVEVVLPASEYGKVEPGALVNVHTDVTGERTLQAKVTLVDRVLDAASNTFRVRLSLPNPDHSIPAGLRCIADFQTEVAPVPEMARLARAEINPMPKPLVTAGGMKLSYQLQTVPKH